MGRSNAAKERAKEVRRNGWVSDKRARDDISSCKMKRETEKIAAMGRIKVKRRQGGKMDGAEVEGKKERLIKKRKDE